MNLLSKFRKTKLAEAIIEQLTEPYVEDPPTPQQARILAALDEMIDATKDFKPLYNDGDFMVKWQDAERGILDIRERMRQQGCYITLPPYLHAEDIKSFVDTWPTILGSWEAYIIKTCKQFTDLVAEAAGKEKNDREAN